MIYDSLQNYVQLRQGFAINKATDSFVSNEQSQEFPYPLLRIADMINGKYAKYVSKKIHKSVIVNQNDLIYTRTGQIGLVFTGFEGVLHNNSFIVDVIDDKIDKQYLYTALQSSFVRQQALTLAKNSVQPDLTHDMFKKIIIPFPSKDIQYKIAGIIGAINKKIVLNNRVNATLEAMAKTLYDYWFVQFDFPDEKGRPYKTSGGKVVYNKDLGREIPAGWEVVPLPQVASLQYGYPLSTDMFCSKGLPVIRIRDIIDNSTSASTNESVHVQYLTEKGDLLVGMDGNFQMNYWTRDGEIVNQRITRIRKKEIPIMIIRFQIEPFITAKITNVARSTVGHLGDTDFKERLIIVPSNLDMSVFDTVIDKIISYRNENRRLAALRDWLLPMLMNGQVGFRKGYF